MSIVERGDKKEKKKEKKSERIYRTSQNIRITKVFLDLLMLESLPQLGVTVHLASLGCPPTPLISGPAVRAAQILIWSCSCVFLPPMSTAIRTSAFSFWELSMSFYVCHRHRVCLAGHLDLIFSLYSLWEGFESSSLATLPLGFKSGFISTFACGSSTGVCS